MSNGDNSLDCSACFFSVPSHILESVFFLLGDGDNFLCPMPFPLSGDSFRISASPSAGDNFRDFLLLLGLSEPSLLFLGLLFSNGSPP